MRTVPIEQIQGSESRSHEFDRNFNPLRGYNKDRWLSIAMARQRDKALPPVELIQVGEVYFVRDGHHRISVARALGQQDIEAEVVVWQVNGPLPWEKLETTPDLTGQTVKAGPFYRQAWDGGVRLLEAGLLNLSSFWRVGGMRLKKQVVSPVNSGERVCHTTCCCH
jgi:hypothetical protein